MTNKKNKIIITIMFFVFFLAIANVTFAASANVTAGKTNLEPGQSTTITASVTSTEAYNLNLSTSGGSLSGTTSNADAFGSEKSQPVLSATFTASSEGNYTITLSGSVTGSDFIKQNISKSLNITVKAPVAPTQPPTAPPTQNPTPTPTKAPATPTPAQNSNKSTNNYLKALTIEGASLSPSFNKNTMAYTVNVGKDVTSIKIAATAEDSKATVTGAGTVELKDGDNDFAIKVAAESGSTRTYKIKITKEAKESIPLGIKTISINGVSEDSNYTPITVSPLFTTEIKEYTCVLDETIQRLIIETELNDETMTMEVVGGEIIKDGENIIEIILKRNDSEETTTYKITATREQATDMINEIKETKEETTNYLQKYGLIIIIITASLLGVGIIFAFVEYFYGKKHPHNVNNDEDINNEDVKETEEISETEEENEPIKSSKKGKRFLKK